MQRHFFKGGNLNALCQLSKTYAPLLMIVGMGSGPLSLRQDPDSKGC